VVETTGVVIAGIGGRMGAEVARAVEADSRFHLAGGIERPDHPAFERLAQEHSLPPDRLTSSFPDLPASARGDGGVLVEFCLGEGAARHAAEAANAGFAIVSGSTALSPEQEAQLHRLAERVPVVRAPNFSWGAAALLHFGPVVRSALGEEYDVEIVETHHRGKRDVPSGTALALALALADAPHDAKEDLRVGRARGENPRRAGEIGVHSVRGGTVPGEHRLLLAGSGETIEIVHRVHSREAFARGVLRAAWWASRAAPGRYTFASIFREAAGIEGGAR
jgi:4-hydroxy-tetrahydrodipicolinate reductase